MHALVAVLARSVVVRSYGSVETDLAVTDGCHTDECCDAVGYWHCADVPSCSRVSWSCRLRGRPLEASAAACALVGRDRTPAASCRAVGCVWAQGACTVPVWGPVVVEDAPVAGPVSLDGCDVCLERVGDGPAAVGCCVKWGAAGQYAIDGGVVAFALTPSTYAELKIDFDGVVLVTDDSATEEVAAYASMNPSENEECREQRQCVDEGLMVKIDGANRGATHRDARSNERGMNSCSCLFIDHGRNSQCSPERGSYRGCKEECAGQVKDLPIPRNAQMRQQMDAACKRSP